MLAQMADRFPHIVELMSEVAHDDVDATLGWCDDQFEFEFALDLILEGLERRRDTAPSAGPGDPVRPSTRSDGPTSRAT